MNLPYMTAATGKNRKQIIAFAGLNYGQGAGDGELAESWGLSSARFPCLSQRDGRKTADNYNNSALAYNAALDEWRKQYHRRHLPIGGGGLTGLC